MVSSEIAMEYRTREAIYQYSETCIKRTSMVSI